MKKKLNDYTPLSKVLTVFFGALSLVWLIPIFEVVNNSLKKNEFINLDPFALPNAESYVGANNYLTANGTYGFWGLVILVAWQQIGYMMIIYIAGLQAVPEDMLEAAKIDGASGWQTLIKVTIPNVMSSITICLFLTLSNGFKLFDQNLALTGGLPYIINPDGSAVHTTEMMALNIYDTFYGQGAAARGTAQAKAVLFFILVAGLGLLQLTSTRKKEVQQ